MKSKLKKIHLQAKKRYLKTIVGTTKKPRLAVFRSHKHIYAQLIDDSQGHTLVASSTVEKNFKSIFSATATQEASNFVGKELAKKAKEKGIDLVIFDRGNRPYHGRIASLAEGAREQGLHF
jgi:large subunit ribosomal protein L18